MELQNIKTCENTSTIYESSTCTNLFLSFDSSLFSQTCTIVHVKNSLEPLNVKDVLKINEKIAQRHFILLLRSFDNGSFAFYWRVENENRVLCLESDDNEKLCEFLKNFLINAVESGSNGKKLYIVFNLSRNT